mmetsp:Transcript_10545/g.15079  ORF Transcript_10545/g.15079 Transcript_10545/m.15079 type:complete len:280 (+) Transcript_10545:246-1085(+)
MLLLHSLKFWSALFLKSVKDVNKQISQHIQHLIVMLNDGHFQIQASKLTQVPTCVGVFSTENRSNFEDPLESTTCRSHLLVQLGTHTQTCWFAKVIEGENISSSFTCSRQQFGGVDFHKVLRKQVFTEECTNHRLDTENRLVGRCAKINPAVVKSSFLSNPASFCRGIGFMIICSHISFLDRVRSASIFHLKWHRCGGFVHTVELFYLNLYLRLCCSLYRVGGHGKCTVHINDRFNGDAIHVFDHSGWNILGFKCDALYGIKRGADQNKCTFSNSSCGV